jgi:hypothetical protein
MRNVGELMKSKKLLFKQEEKVTGYRVLSVNPPTEEASGGGKGRIDSLRFRSIWTYRNVIGRGVNDRVSGSGIIFAENGETLTYRVTGTGNLLSGFKYQVRGEMRFHAHSREGKLAYLDGKKAVFQSDVASEKRIITVVWI